MCCAFNSGYINQNYFIVFTPIKRLYFISKLNSIREHTTRLTTLTIMYDLISSYLPSFSYGLVDIKFLFWKKEEW